MARAVARIDLGAVERNCAHLDATVGERRRALRGGQGRRLRPRRRRLRRRRRSPAARPGWRSRPAPRPPQIGRRFPHVPLLTMGALTEEELDAALAAGSEVARLARGVPRRWSAARARAQGRPARVHVKHDSGMGRLGNRDPGAVLALARACAEDPDLELAGVWTHFATADEPDSDFFDEQLRRFARGRRRGQGRVSRRSPSTPPTAPPSSATRAAHFDMVRCGVAVYGLDPFQGDPAERGLRAGDVAALLRRRRQALRRPATASATGGPGRPTAETAIGVLPIGYGDGVRRGLSNNARGAGRRPPPSAGRHGLDGQRDDRPRRRDRGRAGRRGGADRRPGRGGDPRRGGRARGSARSTTRSPAGSPPGCRARAPERELS